LGYGDGSSVATYIKPLNEVDMRYVYVDGEPRRFVGFPEGTSRIRAGEGTPLVSNNEGIVYGENHNVSMQFSSSAVWANTFSAYVEPIFLARQNRGDLDGLDELEADVHKGYAKLSRWNVEIEAGRDSLWWGQGRRGTLILTNNAPPLEMVKLSNPEPFLLPWYFQYLGPFKYVVFLARLEEDRDFPHAKFGGMRLNFKPHPNFEMGFSRTFLFGGRGSGNDSFGDYLKLLSFVNYGGETNEQSDQLAALDLRLRLPFLRNAEVYLEWGGEDTGLKPDIKELLLQDLGYIIGLYFPRLTEDGRTDLRIEYADNVSERDNSFWYGHTRYTSGYTYKGFILGHSMGPDARDVFARMTHYLRDGLLIGLDFDYMENGRNLGPVVEKNYQLGTDVTFDFTNALSIKGRYGYEEVANFDLVNGDDRQNNLFMTEVRWRF
jgi:hypothetical protein